MHVEKILVCCYGNSCRSPVGEALIRFHLAKMGVNAIVRSCGVIKEQEGVNPANPHSVTLLQEIHQIDISRHRRTFAGSLNLTQFDRIYVMDQKGKAGLVDKFSAPADRVHILCDADGGVPNPFDADLAPEDQDMAKYVPMVRALNKEAHRIAAEIAASL